MSWFRCDNDGNMLLNMKGILEVLKNTSVPEITEKQAVAIQLVQHIIDTNDYFDISQNQLNQILSAIQSAPSETMVNNQKDMIPILNDANNNTDYMNSTITIVHGNLEETLTSTLTIGETDLVITDDKIKENTVVEVYTSKYGVSPAHVDIETGKVILTFKEQIDEIKVKIILKYNIDWNELTTTIIDGIKQNEDVNFKYLKAINEIVSTLPYGFQYGSAVVYNNEIHILGGDGNNTRHYKWDGSSWTSVSPLPYNFYNGSAVVYNNEIHILGGDGKNTKHYKWNGSSWTSVSTLPYGFQYGSAVVYNNEIHILGGRDFNYNGYTKHYKWNGSTWTSVSTLPYYFYQGSAVVYNNEIHILGGGSYINHYKWNGSTWINVSTLPYGFYDGASVVLNNEIHILGSNGDNKFKHYKFDGSTWTSVSTLPYEFCRGSAVVYNNEIHILGGGSYINHYKLDVPLYKRIYTPN